MSAPHGLGVAAGAPVAPLPEARTPAIRPALRALTRREADIFACLCDAVVSPERPFPPVRETRAVRFFDEWLARAPRPNRAGLRGALHALELAPLRLRGFRRRLRALPRERRGEALAVLERGRLHQGLAAVRSMAQLAYYGDDRVMALLGYDAEAVVARGRALRAAEGRW